ncbi:MAG TPA: D-2-hydroxyacid dehydrogenase family protein [Mycobacteriales bacterium]|nr:D-2-hydroxyacid dehydrogenase family protein [Mycobacteriales bacterium]
MSLRCIVLDDYQGVALGSADWSPLAGQVDVTVVRDHLADPSALVERLRGHQIIVAMRERTPLTGEIIAQLPDLRLIVTTGMRNAAIDVTMATERGVVVCGTPGASAPTAELTWALVLAVARHVVDEATSLRRGGPWQSTVGMDLAGRRLGVVGLGRIGSAVATIGLAFGMDVTAWSPNLTAARCAEVGVQLAGGLPDLLRTSDVVSIHLALGDRSRGLIGAAELALMKPTAVLINTSRAAIVDRAALLDALRTGSIAGAGVDVFDVEPLPFDDPFRTLPTVVATPHLGYVTQRNYTENFFPAVVEDIVAFLSGAPIRVLD